MTILDLDCCISLKIIKKDLVVLGVVDMCQLLLNLGFYSVVPSTGYVFSIYLSLFQAVKVFLLKISYDKKHYTTHYKMLLESYCFFIEE